MAIVKITRADMNKYKRIDPPGWYAFLISEVKDPRPSKDKTSNVYETILRVLHDSKEGTSAKDIEVTQYLSDKGVFVILSLVAAAEGVTEEEFLGDREEMEVELNSIAGKKVWAEVTHEEYQGNLNNKLSNFQPYGSKVPF